MDQFIYIIGVVFVIAIIAVSLDDLIWDIGYAIAKWTGNIKVEPINVADIENTPPKMLAVMVAAYNEENVLRPVIRNLILSNQYPDSMYHIFLGVYPNDEGTLRAASELEAEFANVHRVIHVLDGPSSKADNLNNVIRNIYKFEHRNHVRFNAVVVHDSEDLVHPYEFKMENYLLEKHKAIQMPVFPLQEMPRWSNLFKNMITGSYADEFAENHYRLLVARTLTDAFVPSAGTGFVIRRDLLDEYKNGEVFPVGSLTEDYKLSLEFKRRGWDVHYALENVQRLRNDGTLAKDYISTRSMFPSGYKAAVKQKTRWIYGITIQTFKLKSIVSDEQLNFSSKYSLYRDWKAKFSNLLLGPGYLIFLYFVFSLFVEVPVMYPVFSIPWFLIVLLTVLMVERQLLRFIAVKNVYGYKSASISTLFPPFLPFRMIIGNVINFHATVKAWRLNRQNKPNNKKVRKPKWSKTDHEFLEEAVLKRYRRNVGDTLVYKGIITANNLNKALQTARSEGQQIGKVLISKGYVTENQAARAVCDVNHWTFIDFNYIGYINEYINQYDVHQLGELEAIPLFKIKDRFIVLTNIDANEADIFNFFGPDAFLVYSTKSVLHNWLQYADKEVPEDNSLKIIEDAINRGYISVEQGVIALAYKEEGEAIEKMLLHMGLLQGTECSRYTFKQF